MASLPTTDRRGMARQYFTIARPDHWIKNIFAIPGIAAALAFAPASESLWNIPLVLLSLCLIASANYSINDLLDAEYDRFHPIKSKRPGAADLLDSRLVILQYCVLAAGGLALAAASNVAVVSSLLAMLAIGLVYNAPPIRAKDYAYFDVLVESLNNPLRFLVGWFAIAPKVLPPSSVLLAYWMGGAFLMGIKRFSELRWIGDSRIAASYRRSFSQYSELSLLLSAFFYALCSAFFGAIFLIKYKVEFLLTFPLFAALFTWYLFIGLKHDSAAQMPEKLYRECAFIVFATLVFVVAALMFYVDIPMLRVLVDTHLIEMPAECPSPC
jgi:decaprenyl-phosphate phosphoribosyltransferase